ncbi:MAG: DUF975 family protein [Clostridia bacterium]|nr:DUF975 family protein [Clostridia bacterium]
MTVFQIQKNALNCNRSKYIKSILLPLTAILFTVFLTAAPHLLTMLFGYLSISIPENYSIIMFTTKCILIALTGVLSFLFYSSASLGEQAFYGGRMRKKNNCFKRFIFWFNPEKSLKAFTLKLLLFTLKSMWSIIFLLPFTITAAFIFAVAFSGGIEVYLLLSLACGALILLITGLVFRFIFIQRYFLAEFLLTEDPSLKPVQCIKQSKNIIDGHIFRVIRFKLSFLPLFLSCILIIPSVFVYPHYKQSRTIIAKELMI